MRGHAILVSEVSRSGRKCPVSAAGVVEPASVGGLEGEQFGAVHAEPVALISPVRGAPLDERPKAARVAGNAQVAELVHDHVVEHLGGRQHEAPRASSCNSEHLEPRLYESPPVSQATQQRSTREHAKSRPSELPQLVTPRVFRSGS